MKNTFLFVLTFIVLLLPVVALAQVKYAPLIQIDGLTNSVQGESFSQYVNFLYGFSIAIAALLAVIKIIIAGVKYMLSSLPGTKGDAKTEIQGALLGLLLILGAFLILNTINPALTNTAIQFDQIEKQATIQTRPAGVRAAGDISEDIAASRAISAGIVGGCNTTPTTDSDAGFNYRILDLSGCLTGTDFARLLNDFNTDCRTRLFGVFTMTNDSKTSTCRIPKVTTVRSIYGTVTQQAGTTNTTTNTPEQLVRAREACEDRRGLPTTINGPNGTFVGATVRCVLPAIITYTGNDREFALGDCNDRKPKGTLVRSTFLGVEAGEVYCVIRF